MPWPPLMSNSRFTACWQSWTVNALSRRNLARSSGRKGFALLALPQYLADVLLHHRESGVGLGAGLGQTGVDCGRIGGSAGAGGPFQPRRELVNHSLRYAYHRADQVPAQQRSDRHPVAGLAVQFPAGPVAVARGVDVKDSVVRNESVLGNNVLAAAAAQARDVPRIHNLEVAAGNQHPVALSDVGRAQHHPARVVAAAGELPTTRQPVSALDWFAGSLPHIQRAGQ